MWSLTFPVLVLLSGFGLLRDAQAAPMPQELICVPDVVDRTYDLIAITDMDKDAGGSPSDWTWRAVKRKGQLTISGDGEKIAVNWDPSADQNVTTHLNVKGRAMELSDLALFNGHLISPDDKTGMIYQIEGQKAIPWVFLNSGPGNTTNGMKAEWMALKDGQLYVGGHGTEYRAKDGSIVSTDSMWIKIVSADGAVQHKDWTKNYEKIRDAAGFPAPGYLTHEAVQWSKVHHRWFFIPRRHSKKIYDEEADERRGSNKIISADENFDDFYTIDIGALKDRKRGFSAFAFIPGTCDELALGIKSVEFKGTTESYITAFDLMGNIYLEDQRLQGNLKFEGLYIVKK
nr:apyrase-3 [Heligmosomoides bakeri]